MHAISSYRCNRPTNTQIQTQTGPITIQTPQLARSVIIYDAPDGMIVKKQDYCIGPLGIHNGVRLIVCSLISTITRRILRYLYIHSAYSNMKTHII